MTVNRIEHTEILMADYLKVAMALESKPEYSLYSKEEQQWDRENPHCNKTRLRRLGKEIRIKMQEVEE